MSDKLIWHASHNFLINLFYFFVIFMENELIVGVKWIRILIADSATFQKCFKRFIEQNLLFYGSDRWFLPDLTDFGGITLTEKTHVNH